MGKNPRYAKEGLNRGAWTAEEDSVLRDYIRINGQGKWGSLPTRAGLKRCGKSCRLRWLNYLRPDIKRGNISDDEEDLIIRLHKLLGNRWSLIAGRLPGRTDNEIKNYWNTNILKKLKNGEALNQNNDGSNTSLSPNNSTFPMTFPSEIPLNPQIQVDDAAPSTVNSPAQATASDDGTSTKNQSGDFHGFGDEFLQSGFETEDPIWNFATNFDAVEELWLSDLLRDNDFSGAYDYSNGGLSFILLGRSSGGAD